MPVLTPLRQLAILSLLALVVGVPACARAPDVAVPREPEIRSADEAEAAFWRAQQELAAAMGSAVSDACQFADSIQAAGAQMQPLRLNISLMQ